MSSRINKTNVLTSLAALIAGTTKHLRANQPVLLIGTSYTPATLNSKLEAYATAINDTATARQAYRATVQDEDAVAVATQPLVTAYVAYIRASYGDQAYILGDFGLTPKKKTKTSSKAKAVAVEKRATTRKQNGTMGPKEHEAAESATAPSATATIPTGNVAPTKG